jgi:hypothetical protein
VPPASAAPVASAGAAPGAWPDFAPPEKKPIPAGLSPDAPAALRRTCEAASARAQAAFADLHAFEAKEEAEVVARRVKLTGSPLAPHRGPPEFGPDGVIIPPEDLEASGRCFAAGKGAWLLDVDAPPAAARPVTTGRPPRPRLWPSFVTVTGHLIRAPMPLRMDGDSPPTGTRWLCQVGPIVDLDRDLVPDLQITFEGIAIDEKMDIRNHQTQRFFFHANRIDSGG